jgi:hypothetical protein
MLRKIFGPKREEVTGEWRRLHNKKLCDLYFLQNMIWVIKSGRIWNTEDRRAAYRVLVGRPDGKRPLGRPKPIWEDTIKMDFWIFEKQGVEAWTRLIWLRIGTGGRLL